MEDSDTFPLLEEERPEPERGEVRVRVLAADLSLPDLMITPKALTSRDAPSATSLQVGDLVGVVDSDSAMASLESNQGRQWPWGRGLPMTGARMGVKSTVGIFNARQSGGLDIGAATRHAFMQPRTSIIRL